jgi:2-polyprenyl-6-methoxyphenol hydroxylase-like FAD-dependent oxidoreductase
MAVDYDLVIAGGTVQGRRAAALAAREGARVALVEPPRRVESGLAVSAGLERLTSVTGRGDKPRPWRRLPCPWQPWLPWG